jgi:hypothetical protein
VDYENISFKCKACHEYGKFSKKLSARENLLARGDESREMEAGENK